MKKNIFFSLIIIIGCEKKSYDVYGTIIDIRTISNELLIHHDEIPGFMVAMTMPFSIHDSINIERFSIGDSVHFKLTLELEKGIASNFELKGKGTLSNQNDGWENEFSPLDIGEIFNDVSFLSLDSTIISLSNTDGKFRLISFIFSRCPMPNMCPALVVKNQYLADEFSDNENIEFILISFDYIYDTPSMMKSIYDPQLSSYPNINYWSSFGHIDDLYMLTEQSFVSFWGIEKNDVGHSLRSILIDPERRLLKAYDGLNWRPELAAKDIKNILRVY